MRDLARKRLDKSADIFHPGEIGVKYCDLRAGLSDLSGYSFGPFPMGVVVQKQPAHAMPGESHSRSSSNSAGSPRYQRRLSRDVTLNACRRSHLRCLKPTPEGVGVNCDAFA